MSKIKTVKTATKKQASKALTRFTQLSKVTVTISYLHQETTHELHYAMCATKTPL